MWFQWSVSTVIQLELEFLIQIWRLRETFQRTSDPHLNICFFFSGDSFVGLGSMIFLPQPPDCWNFRCVTTSSHSCVFAWLFPLPRVSFLKSFTFFTSFQCQFLWPAYFTPDPKSKHVSPLSMDLSILVHITL